MYNKCLALRNFPELWKQGKIKLINKPEKDFTTVKGYRPVTLLPLLGKLYEKALKIFLEEELTVHKVINNNQFVYIENRSTELAAEGLVLAEDFRKKQEYVVIISFDVSGVFDNVSWTAILKILKSKDLTSSIRILVKKFLIKRTVGQCLEDETRIYVHNLEAGVLQGSVPGPTFLIAAFSELHRTIKKTDAKMVSYADDLALIVGCNNESELIGINEIIVQLQN